MLQRFLEWLFLPRYVIDWRNNRSNHPKHKNGVIFGPCNRVFVDEKEMASIGLEFLITGRNGIVTYDDGAVVSGNVKYAFDPRGV